MRSGSAERGYLQPWEIIKINDYIHALMKGDDAKGLSAAPSDEINVQLTKIETVWKSFKSATAQAPSDDNNLEVARISNALITEIAVVREMFESL